MHMQYAHRDICPEQSNADHATTGKSGRVDMTGAEENSLAWLHIQFIHTPAQLVDL